MNGLTDLKAHLAFQLAIDAAETPAMCATPGCSGKVRRDSPHMRVPYCAACTAELMWKNFAGSVAQLQRKFDVLRLAVDEAAKAMSAMSVLQTEAMRDAVAPLPLHIIPEVSFDAVVAQQHGAHCWKGDHPFSCRYGSPECPERPQRNYGVKGPSRQEMAECDCPIFHGGECSWPNCANA